MEKTLRFRKEDLLDYVVQYMGALQVSEEDARIIGDVLIEADCRGTATHGLIRLSSYYGHRLKHGYMDPASPMETVQETDTTALIDGGNGCGQVVSFHAMNRCIEKAKRSGLSMVTVRRSNHFGIAAYYAMMALKHDMIGICLTNSQPLTAATHGKTAVLGTNPIAAAVPTEHEFPYVLDMATSTVPIGKIKLHEKQGIPIPFGWAVDDQGEVTDDPLQVQSGGPGALMPLGGTEEMRGYKGYGLALLVDILCGVLSGGKVLTDVGFPHEPKESGVCHAFMAVSIDAFRPFIDFTRQMDRTIRMLKSAPKAAGQDQIFIAGEKEYLAYQENTAAGVPLIEPVVEEIRTAGEEAGVPFRLRPVTQQSRQEPGPSDGN